jgi:hypothetical protein
MYGGTGEEVGVSVRVRVGVFVVVGVAVGVGVLVEVFVGVGVIETLFNNTILLGSLPTTIFLINVSLETLIMSTEDV